MPSPVARLSLALALVLVAATGAVQATAPHDAHRIAPTPAPVPAVEQGAPNGSLNVTVRSGPGADWAALSSTDAIRTAVAADRLPATQVVTRSDPLVVAIEHGPLSEWVADGNATHRFRQRLDESAVTFRIRQTNPSVEREAKRVHLTPNATRVVADAANGTVYVVLDTNRTAVTYGPQDDDPTAARLRPGDEFGVTVTLSGASNLTDGARDRTAETGFQVRTRQARLAIDDDLRERIYVTPAPNRTISGVTNVRAGLDVTVLVRRQVETADETTTTVIRRRTVPVRAPGAAGNDDGANRFAASFDLGDVPEGTTATVAVLFDGRSLLERNATLVAVSPAADVRARGRADTAGPFPALRVDTSLSRGGFVLLHRGTASGPVAGVSEYLPPGTRENVTVYVGYPTNSSRPLVAVAHRDANHNHWFDSRTVDGPYATTGAAVARTNVTASPTTPSTGVTTRTRTDDGTTSTTESTATATTGVETNTSRSSPSTTATTGPGFGVAAALAGVLAGALGYSARSRSDPSG